MDDPHALITGGVLVADLSAAVGGAVVDEKHLDGTLIFWARMLSMHSAR